MADPDTVITPYRDGPLLIRGPFQLLDQDGNEIALGGRETTTALCRCGKSRLRPFCDGTHNVIRFELRAGRSRGASRTEKALGQPRRRRARAEFALALGAVALEGERGQFVPAAKPLRHGGERLQPLGEDLADRAALAGCEVGELAVEAVARGEPAVLGDLPGSWDGAARHRRARSARPRAHARRRRARPPPAAWSACRTRAPRACRGSRAGAARTTTRRLGPVPTPRPAQHLRERRPGVDRWRDALARAAARRCSGRTDAKPVSRPARKGALAASAANSGR